MKSIARILIFFIVISIFPNEFDPAKSGLEEFISNPAVGELINQYEEGQIRTIQDLLQRLNEINFKLSICTLKRYLKKIKVRKSLYLIIFTLPFRKLHLSK
jgi:hypothetical protein